jgi:hypothetical protein
MIPLLRRSRLLVLTLLLATPALGGAWLQAAHPCPVDSPWLAEHEDGHGDHGAPAGHGACQCVGTCAGAAVAVLAASTVLPPATAPAPAVRPRLTPGVTAPGIRPSDRLPPATAPPLL